MCCCTVWTNEDTLLCADSHIKMNTWCTVAKTVSMKSNWPQACKTYPSLHNNKVLRYLIQRLKPLFPLQCTSVCSGLVKRIWGAESAWHENLLAKKNQQKQSTTFRVKWIKLTSASVIPKLDRDSVMHWSKHKLLLSAPEKMWDCRDRRTESERQHIDPSPCWLPITHSFHIAKCIDQVSVGYVCTCGDVRVSLCVCGKVIRGWKTFHLQEL